MSPLTLRPRLNAAHTPADTAITLTIARAMPFRVQVVVIDGEQLADLEDVSSISMLVKSTRTDLEEASLIAGTVAAAAFEECTLSQWIAGTHQQATFEFSAAEANITLNGAAKGHFWVVFKALLISGEPLILAQGILTITESNASNAGEPAVNPAPSMSVAEADARFLRIDGAQELTEGQQAQALENLGLDGPGGVTDHGALSGLADDDHTQYHTDARGDARYSPLGHGHADKADLVGGVIPTAQIPAIAITTFLGAVGSQAAMLALSGQMGDWCNRTDTSTAWVIIGTDPTQLASWGQINYPASPVTSVNGQTGVIVLGYADVGSPPNARTVNTQHSLQGGGDLSANRTLSLVADTANPGANQLYGTDSLGARAWRRALYKLGPVQIYGHTNPSTPASPPPSLVLTFSSNPTGHFEIVDEGNSQVFTFAGADPSNGSTWIDTSGLSDESQIAEACETALLSSFLADLQISRDGAVITIGRTNEGADYSLTCTNHSGLTDVTGGGSGTDEGPPSGGLLSLDIYNGGAASIIAAYWWSENGLGAGVELIDFSDDTVISTVSAPGSNSSGVLTPNSMAGAMKFNALSSMRLRCVDEDIEGGEFSLVLFML